MWDMCLLLICILHNQFYEIHFRLTGIGVNPSLCHFSSNASCSSLASSCNGECFTTITASIPHPLQTRQLCTLPSPVVSYIWRQYTQATKFFSPTTSVFTLFVTHCMYPSFSHKVIVIIMMIHNNKKCVSIFCYLHFYLYLSLSLSLSLSLFIACIQTPGKIRLCLPLVSRSTRCATQSRVHTYLSL